MFLTLTFVSLTKTRVTMNHLLRGRLFINFSSSNHSTLHKVPFIINDVIAPYIHLFIDIIYMKKEHSFVIVQTMLYFSETTFFFLKGISFTS